MTRTWTDANGNFVPDCDLTNPLAQSPATTGSIDTCGQISNLLFGSNQFVGANFDPGVLSGWGVRPSDWSFGASVQQQIFPKASVEVGYYRRMFTMFTTGGIVTDNLNVGPNDLTPFYLTAPSDPRLPGGGGYQVGPLYNLTPEAFARPQDLLIKSTKDVGDDTRVFNGVDMTFNVRNVKGVTFSGGTSTGKVVNDWCAIRAAVPENTFRVSWTLNPFCHVESPFQTSFNGLASYVIPKIDVLISGVYRDRPILNGTPNNASTDQLGGSLPANLTFTATDAFGTGDRAANRPSDDRRSVRQREPDHSRHVLWRRPGVRRPQPADRPEPQEDHPHRQPAPDGGARHLQPGEQQHGSLLQHDVRSKCHGLADAVGVHEPARLPSRRRVRVVDDGEC